MNDINQEEYHELVKQVKRHDELYYAKCTPEISDYEYDQLVKDIEAIEKRHPDWVMASSPTQSVNEKTTSGFKTVQHKIPMLSLANTYSEEELDDFIGRMQRLLEREEIDFFVELKMDGVAISVRYEEGHLVQGVTRGNGKQGDDVTENVKAISNLPLQLKGKNIPKALELRGEVYLPIKTFQALNSEKEEAGQDVWANPRNAAAGSLKLLDVAEVKRRKLCVVFYDVVRADGITIKTQSAIPAYIASLGLPCFSGENIARCTSSNEIHQFATTIQNKRASFPFEIDGIVIKVDTIEERKYLGYTGKSPRWAVAYKFAPEQAITSIEDITVQVGRTGVLTPVAELNPVKLAGSTISRATLHNQDEIERKDIRIGDVVVIEKGGDVIPKVVSVDVTKRRSKAKPWKMPRECPGCKKQVVHDETEVAYRCPDPTSCPAGAWRRISFFVSKGAMDIENLGEKVVQKLMEQGMIVKLSDIYRLTKDDLLSLEGFKEKSAQNLIDSIEKSKTTALSRFLFALGIKFVGIGGAEILANHYRSIDAILSATKDDLLDLEGMGPKMADSVIEYLGNPGNIQEIKELLALGVAPTPPAEKRLDHPFADKTFVLTGSLLEYTRTQAATLIKERGGKVSSSVSKKTDFVLAGADPGSKYKKAKSLGVTILSESEFKKFVD